MYTYSALLSITNLGSLSSFFTLCRLDFTTLWHDQGGHDEEGF